MARLEMQARAYGLSNPRPVTPGRESDLHRHLQTVMTTALRRKYAKRVEETESVTKVAVGMGGFVARIAPSESEDESGLVILMERCVGAERLGSIIDKSSYVVGILVGFGGTGLSTGFLASQGVILMPKGMIMLGVVVTVVCIGLGYLVSMSLVALYQRLSNMSPEELDRVGRWLVDELDQELAHPDKTAYLRR